MDEKIREIEERLDEVENGRDENRLLEGEAWVKYYIVLSNAEKDERYLLSLLKKCQGELSKWTAPHEDIELQEMKEQSNQVSLSAKQAYINALEWRIKHLEARVKELEEGIKGILPFIWESNIEREQESEFEKVVLKLRKLIEKK